MAKMPLVYNDPLHWRRRALEAVELAERMVDGYARDRMLEVAAQYNLIADRAVARLKAHAQGAAPLVL